MFHAADCDVCHRPSWKTSEPPYPKYSSEALAEQRWFLSSLRDEGAVAKRLMQVLGTSAYVPDLLMRAPEVIQSYADGPAGPKLLEVEPDGVARALVASAAANWATARMPT